MKQLTSSHRALAELKGYADMIPNKNILLINAITINEAKDSSEIENIITTHDELFKAICPFYDGNGKTGRIIKVTVEGKWEEWVLFILQGIEETADETLMLIKVRFQFWNVLVKKFCSFY